MLRVIFAAIVCAVISAAACWAGTVTVVTDADRMEWIRHTVPLPKSIEITAKSDVPADKVAVVYEGPAHPVVDQAIKEIKQTIGCAGDPASPAFTLRMVIGGPDAGPLKDLKNSDQAYRILATGQSSNEISLVARTERGLYYAAKTLQQLIAAKKSGSSVSVPILEVTDWPDLDKRGLWGSDNFLHLRWLADRKMNLCEQISDLSIDESGKPVARLKEHREPLIDEGPLYGIEFSPVVLHLEQSGAKIIAAHPNLKGKSDHPGVMCYSQPECVDIIAEWIYQLASLPTVTSVDCWMTENLAGKTGCQCCECEEDGWAVLEARTIVAAWKKAREKLGRPFRLRTMTTEATEAYNRQVFNELPRDVEVGYYHSLLTYNSMRRPMLRPYVAREAARRWMGVAPSLCAAVGFCEPFTGAAFVHYRMNEFVDKGLSGLLAYATPRVHYYAFNVEAAAEWSWNAKGRSTREFAISYAVRQGCGDPERFAEWSETLGPVAWDVYGSGFPNEETRNNPGHVAYRLKEGRLRELGFVLWDVFASPWGSIRTEAQLEADVKAAAKGVKLAGELGMPGIIAESLVVDGYIRAIAALYELKRIVTPRGVKATAHDAARDAYRRYVRGLGQARAALRKWEAAVRTSAEPDLFTDKPVETVDEMLTEMREVAVKMGFER